MTVKLRFAPSPTGKLHVGNARTALVNYLFCKSKNGEMLLRIDDTDQERSKLEYEKSIKEDLNWLGIFWEKTDRQSSRLKNYNDALQHLFDIGRAYRCYETQEELSLKRKAQLMSGNPPVYDRQGLSLEQALEFTRVLKASHQLCLTGVSSHFANMEDTVNQGYAELQMSRLLEAANEIESLWGQPLLKHIANSAATLMWPKRALDLARVGISAYGLWPSKLTQTLVAEQLEPRLKPGLSWRARIVQVKEVPKGEPIGYGCTYITTRPTRLAILPIGYYEGYDRGLSNRGQVLIKGQRAKVLGRICMNICMVDVSDIPNCKVGTIATLLGESGSDCITADEIANWADTINYEIVARIAGHIPRYEVK